MEKLRDGDKMLNEEGIGAGVIRGDAAVESIELAESREEGALAKSYSQKEN